MATAPAGPASNVHDLTDAIAEANAASEAAEQIEHSEQLIEEFARAAAKAPAPDRTPRKAIDIKPARVEPPADYAWEGRPWAPLMLSSPKGVPKPLLANAITALSLDPEWKDVLAHDVFAQSTCATAQPPIDAPMGVWSDVHDIRTTEWLQRVGIVVGTQIAAQAVEAVARNRSYHPVKLYLEEKAADWDRTYRAEHWLMDFCGCEDTPYVRAVGQLFLVGAVARIYSPGCKLDTALILEGSQGKGKSSVFERLFTPWFTDDMGELGSKDSGMQVAGVWCIELAELSQMTRAEIEPVKAFLTRRVDRFRPPYGRRVVETPRQSVFGGSVNPDSGGAGYLKDDENRRFLPVRVGEALELDALADMRDQLWGEAVHLYRAGVKWWMTDQAVLADAVREQAERRQMDAWDGRIAEWLKGRLEADFSVGDILEGALDIRPERWDQVAQNRVGRVMRQLNYTKFQKRVGNSRTWRFRPRAAPAQGAPEDADAAP